jgi:glycosyltransferase involved in cell wall biosynthesis
VSSNNYNILIVVRWPLGGIRTYMRYMFAKFPSNYRLTILAESTQEDVALVKDIEMYHATLLLIRTGGTQNFIKAVYRELRNNNYNLILSQGFVSAVAVYLAQFILFEKVPHILTIHGILEPKYLKGGFALVKRWVLGRALSSVSVLYGVSEDILEHLYQVFPKLRSNGPKPLIILNGIEPSIFELQSLQPFNLREQLGIDSSIFLFGFFGRFMPQKGFDLLISAVERLSIEKIGNKFAVVAIGSGDYIREYQSIIKAKGIESIFHFLPFQPMVHCLYPQVDAVVIPSRWEACPLLPMEVLCMGSPLIASDCLGLREITVDTPTLIFKAENLEHLIERMHGCFKDNKRLVFKNYSNEARKRFDVAKSSEILIMFIEQQLSGK